MDVMIQFMRHMTNGMLGKGRDIVKKNNLVQVLAESMHTTNTSLKVEPNSNPFVELLFKDK